MQNTVDNILRSNNLTLSEVNKRTTISKKRNILYLSFVGTVTLGLVIVAILDPKLESVLISLTMLIAGLLELRRKWFGRPILIIDQPNQQLLIPTSSEYEHSSKIDFSAIIAITSEQAGTGELNYYFIEETGKKPQQILKLNIDSQLHSSEITNWLNKKVTNKC